MENNQNSKEEVQELESRLKTLKQQNRGEQGNPYMIPGAVILAGVLIAGAVVYSQGNSSTGQQAAIAGNTAPPTSAGSADDIKAVNSDDHIRGNPDASVKIVEFSDLECPFCKRFHATMQQVVDEYEGKVAWVYRHFPLDSLHSKARAEAEATECANELGGNDAFWTYLDKVFEITPSNNGLDLDQLPQIAEDIGLSKAKFEECLSSGKYAQHIEDDYQDSLASGGTGTPYSVIIAADGSTTALSGAQPFSAIKSLVDLAL